MQGSIEISLFLLSGTPLISLGSITETLRTAANWQNSPLVTVKVVALSRTVVTAEGLTLQTDLIPDPESIGGPAWVFVLGNSDHQDPAELDQAAIWLQSLQASRPGAMDLQLIGVDGGTAAILSAGFLQGRRAALPVFHQPALRQAAAQARPVSDLFAGDGWVWTTRGGTAVQDLLLFLLGRELDPALSDWTSRALIARRWGASRSGQPLPASRVKVESPQLAQVVALMQSNLEEPLSLDELSRLSKMSRRHMERLFRKHLDTVPSRYYLRLRLEQARGDVLETRHSMTDIAQRCGFTNSGHFATAYRNAFGMTPTEHRALRSPVNRVFPPRAGSDSRAE